MPYMFYLPFLFLQQSVFGTLGDFMDLKKYRDTDVDYQFIDSSIGENIKDTKDAYKRMYTHK